MLPIESFNNIDMSNDSFIGQYWYPYLGCLFVMYLFDTIIYLNTGIIK